MTISASTIKDLREATGAGMMDCKKALNETNGDIEAAKDWLREKGIAKASKKAGRVAAEGLVGVAIEGNKGAIIELNSETDFVAKNEQFQELVKGFSQVALNINGDINALDNATCPTTGKKPTEVLTDAIATIGENLSLRRMAALEVDEGMITSYIHNAQAPNMGKIGVIIALKSSGDTAKLEALGKQLAMHIAAAKPVALTRDEVPTEELDRERKIFTEQARNSGKPDNIIEKMVEGRIRKFYEEVVLPEQVFVIDGKTKVEEIVAQTAKEIGADIEIAGYVQYTLGEGIDKKEENFADEVAAAANG